MKRTFNYNFEKKTIVGTKVAIEKANKGLEPEYSELTEMLASHPNFTVTIKSIKRKEGKKTYSKLTFERMKEYIETQYSNKEDLNKKLVEFESIKQIAKTKGAMYPLTKKWFLHTYTEYKETIISGTESDEMQKALAAAATQLEMLVDGEEFTDEYDEETAA